MKDLPDSQPPIAPLSDVDLEQISGGVDNLYSEAKSAYNQISDPLKKILGGYEDEINQWAIEIKLQKVLNVLETYDTSSCSKDYLNNYFANSWNEKHPNGKRMAPWLAEAILAVPNKYDRAAIACLPTTDDMINALNSLLNG